MTNVPTDESKQIPIADKLDQIGKDHGVGRRLGEGDEAYAERLIDAIDGRVEKLWGVQDDICMLLIANDSAA